MGDSQQKRLSSGLKALNLDYPLAVQAQLLDYVRLLSKWNRVYNLTAVRDPTEMVTRHLLDSLSVLPYLRGNRVLDVGTGAGLPGIPLAIVSEKVSPEREFVLLDSNSKKTRFVQQAIAELGLGNVQVVHARIEDFQSGEENPAATFDTVLSRAFATVADMLSAAGRHCAATGVILAMKGVDPADQLTGLDAAYVVQQVHRLSVPGLGEERHVVCLTPSGGMGQE